MTFGDTYKNAEPPEAKSFDALPKGEYTATLTHTTINLVDNRLEWEFRVSDGEYANRKLWRNVPWDKEWGPGAIKGDVQTLGLDDSSIQDPADFQKILTPLWGKKFKLAVTTRDYNGKTYNNVYINGYFNEAEAVAVGLDSAVPGVDTSENIPF